MKLTTDDVHSVQNMLAQVWESQLCQLLRFAHFNREHRDMMKLIRNDV